MPPSNPYLNRCHSACLSRRRLRRVPLLLLLAGLLTTAAAAPAAPEQLRVNPAQIARAGIATTPALAALPAAGAEAAGNDQYLAGTVVAPGTALARASSAGRRGATGARGQPAAGGRRRATVDPVQPAVAGHSAVSTTGPGPPGRAKLARRGAVRRRHHRRARRRAQRRPVGRFGGGRAAPGATRRRFGPCGNRRAKGRPALSPMLTVRAQYAGTVLELPVSPGQRIEAGAELARIGHGPRGSSCGPRASSADPFRRPVAGQGLRQAAVVAISPVVNSANQTPWCGPSRPNATPA